MQLTISAMMKTTMLHVIGMVEHAVTTKMMDGIPLAQNANVLVSRLFLQCNTILVLAQACERELSFYNGIIKLIVIASS